MWVREATKLTTCYQPSGIVGSTSWQLVLQISQVATDEMRGVALNGHFYQLSQHKQYLTIIYRKLKEGIGIHIKRKADHWPTNIFSVSFTFHLAWEADLQISPLPCHRFPQKGFLLCSRSSKLVIICFFLQFVKREEEGTQNWKAKAKTKTPPLGVWHKKLSHKAKLALVSIAINGSTQSSLWPL